MTRTLIFVIVDLFVIFVLTASAQARRPSVPRVEASFGVGFSSGSDLGERDATLLDRNGAPYLLFATSSQLTSSVPIEGRLGYAITPRYAIEARGVWSRPELRTSISQDVEGAPPVVASERIDQYQLEGSFVVMLDRLRFHGVAPFASGGVGWVGQVHEEYTLIEHGISYRGGGGLKYRLSSRDRGFVRGVGIRADAGFVVMTKGIESDGGASHRAEVSGSIYLVF